MLLKNSTWVDGHAYIVPQHFRKRSFFSNWHTVVLECQENIAQGVKPQKKLQNEEYYEN